MLFPEFVLPGHSCIESPLSPPPKDRWSGTQEGPIGVSIWDFVTLTSISQMLGRPRTRAFLNFVYATTSQINCASRPPMSHEIPTNIWKLTDVPFNKNVYCISNMGLAGRASLLPQRVSSWMTQAWPCLDLPFHTSCCPEGLFASRS